MSTKKRLIERIGRRMDMIQESLPPELLFTEIEPGVVKGEKGEG